MKTLSTKEIIANIEKNGVITEKEVNLLKRRANAGDKTAADFSPCVELTKEQSEKGFKWLYNLYKTPRGVERENNPFICMARRAPGKTFWQNKLRRRCNCLFIMLVVCNLKATLRVLLTRVAII